MTDEYITMRENKLAVVPSQAEAFFLQPARDCVDFSRINEVAEQHDVQLTPDKEIEGYYRFTGDNVAICEAIKNLDDLPEVGWLCYLVTEQWGRRLYNATPGAWCVFLD